ncbi:MAG: HAMP domain-containing sensor histidine kinase [Bacteroidetes bacterium]|nr:HAMP domain-containing sensor histidine kinase [Bacteroidota bacterium]
MTIRNRLTLQFTGLVGILLLLVLMSIYFVTKFITRNEFYDRLKERADIAAQIFLEQDELSKNSYDLVQQKYFKKLPGEIIQIFNSQNNTQFIADNPKSFFSSQLLDKVRKEKVVYYKEQENQVVGTYYLDNQGDFVIFVLAADGAGAMRLKELLILMFISYLIALFIIYFAGRFFSRKSLESIPKVVSQVNRITASNLHLRVDEGKYKDEIAELASTFNAMLSRLEESFEMQKTFVSNASHELRTPLTSIIGELEVFLSRSRTNEEYKEALLSVLNDAEQMNELTTGLLNIAQIGFNQSEIQYEDIRVDEFMVEMVKEITLKEPDAKIIFNYADLPDESSQLIIKGNKPLLSIAFSNLFQNALKFSKYQPVHCSLHFLNDAVEIRITDKGIGIPEDELNKVFQPFYRSGDARNFSGHGLGLALVDKIMRLHHFSIQIESKPGDGTTVHILFPHTE